MREPVARGRSPRTPSRVPHDRACRDGHSTSSRGLGDFHHAVILPHWAGDHPRPTSVGYPTRCGHCGTTTLKHCSFTPDSPANTHMSRHPWSWSSRGVLSRSSTRSTGAARWGARSKVRSRSTGCRQPGDLVERRGSHPRHALAGYQQARLACRRGFGFPGRRMAAVVLLCRPRRPHDVIILRRVVPSLPHPGYRDLSWVHPRAQLSLSGDAQLAPPRSGHFCCLRR